MLPLPLIQRALDALHAEWKSLQLADAQTLLNRHYPNLSVDRPALIGLLAAPSERRQLSNLLQQIYPPEHGVTLVGETGEATLDTRSLPLNRLGEAALAAGTWMLYLPPLPFPGAIETFQDTVARLRAPDGCPWDRRQTHQSLRQSVQEEAYEVLEALDRQDIPSLKEELGDMLLLVLMQTQIAAEGGEFLMGDVIRYANAKIVRRHPHVFAGLAVNGVDEVLVNWEEIKRQEKAGETRPRSALESIPRALPALARAQSIQRHASETKQVNVPTEDLLARISTTISAWLAETNPDCRRVCLGDLLFDLANLARRWDVDAESALREANDRFEQRFQQ